jgi:hypothetical protein
MIAIAAAAVVSTAAIAAAMITTVPHTQAPSVDIYSVIPVLYTDSNG